MNDVRTDQVLCADESTKILVDESTEILANVTLEFAENMLIENCDDYGCTCISHEKCCGCLLQ